MRRMEPWLIYRNSYGFEVEFTFVILTTLLQIEIKYKHKYRLILDESFSFGAVGRTGRGLTELYNVPVSMNHPHS